MKRNDIILALIKCFILLVIGLLFIVVSPASVMHVVLIIFGIYLILTNIFYVLQGAMNYNNPLISKPKFFTSTISLIFGVLLIFWQNGIMNLVLAGWFILIPIIRISLSQDKKTQLRKEVPHFIMGILFIIFGPWKIFDILFKIVGSILMVLAVIDLVINVYLIKKTEKKEKILDVEILSEKRVD